MTERKKTSGGNTGRSRGKRVNVKTARGRKNSSTRWLDRQLNDPYVAEAKRLGYRSRAAFKFAWLDEKYALLNGANTVVDLGAAPGGWTQIAVERLGGKVRVIGIDLLEIEPIAGAELHVMDFMSEDAEDKLIAMCNGKVDLVMSDMSNSTTGHRATDHIRTLALCEASLEFAEKILNPGGNFVAKVFRGGTEGTLLQELRRLFTSVKHAKPPASRAESVELYVVATGFRG